MWTAKNPLCNQSRRTEALARLVFIRDFFALVADFSSASGLGRGREKCVSVRVSAHKI